MMVKLSVHGAPTDEIEDWFETDPTSYLGEEERAIVEEVHAFVRAPDYTPLAEEDVRLVGTLCHAPRRRWYQG